jgi:hypothetical protein
MHVWAIRVRLQIERRNRDLALFDIALTASYGPATWWLCACRTLWRPGRCGAAQSWSAKRLADPCNLRSQSKPDAACRLAQLQERRSDGWLFPSA